MNTVEHPRSTNWQVWAALALLLALLALGISYHELLLTVAGAAAQAAMGGRK